METRKFSRRHWLPANLVGIAGGRTRATIFILAAAALCQPASAQQRPAPPAPRMPTPQAGAPAVSQQAERLLKELGAYIGSAQEFTFHADITFDHVLPSGQKLQFSAGEDVWLHRPGRVRVDWNGDLGARRFWYDGQTVTVWDPSKPFYASQAVPPTIDAMLETIVKELNFSPPLVDLLYRDPYKTVRGNLQVTGSTWATTTSMAGAAAPSRSFKRRSTGRSGSRTGPRSRPAS